MIDDSLRDFLRDYLTQVAELRKADTDREDKIRAELITTFDKAEASKREMKNELTRVFEIAHAENKMSLELLRKSVDDRMSEVVQRMDVHERKDDSRFESIFRWMWVAIGGAAVVLWLAEHLGFEKLFGGK